MSFRSFSIFSSIFVRHDYVWFCVCPLSSVFLFAFFLYHLNSAILLGVKYPAVNAASLPFLQFARELRIFFSEECFFSK